MIDTIDKKLGHPRPKYDTTNWVDYINQVAAILNSLTMRGANFYQNTTLRGYVLAEQIEFLLLSWILFLVICQIYHLDFILRFTGD
ncbi:hypothetical protein N5E66_05140 [Acinetobacter johnsonii]|uniref:hypothetical protein n=1 Tax=Acinetobacter johnsonii TaxID=40214 RepID=UPI002449CB2B|nr:hypothetical protein [Acinetobacter johnsonii]MDH1487623.1 hypothetical protein [Acinetobacter johnsonii]MDH1613554.1 hypothetical protein [Acinetobacter johnsonii]